MKKTPTTASRCLALAAITLAITFAMAGCKGTGSVSDSDVADTLAIADSVPAAEIIAWKAYQGLPLDDEDIDSIIDYFHQADVWTKAQARNISTPEAFDSLDALYTRKFPYNDVFSAVLETYAEDLTEERMERLHATALSLGATIDSLARAAGLDPDELKEL